MIIYVVTCRYGCELEEPMVFLNKKDAEEFIKRSIAENIREDHCDELKEDRVDFTNDDEVIDWGTERDFCDETTSFKDRDEWHEFLLSERSINVA